jgi:hypothetical protein
MVDMSTPLFSTPTPDTAPSRSVLLAIGALSLVAVAFLIWLIYFKGGTGAPERVSFSASGECHPQFHERGVPSGRLPADSSPRNHSSQAIDTRSNMLFCLVPR